MECKTKVKRFGEECGWIKPADFKELEREVVEEAEKHSIFKHEIGLAPLKRLMQKKAVRHMEGNKPFNVARDATQLLRREVEAQVREIGGLAANVARDHGRVTIKAEDIQTAKELLTPKWEDEVLERGYCPECFHKMEDMTDKSQCDFARVYVCSNCGKKIMTMLKLGE